MGLTTYFTKPVAVSAQQFESKDNSISYLTGAGDWSAVQSFPSVAIHATLLPNGQVLFWARDDSRLDSDTWTWDPKTNTFQTIFNPYTHLFCAGHSLLPDGRLLATGGHHFDNFRGEPHTNIFDYRTNSWSKAPDMNAGRWYPTNTTLANGEVLVVAGTDINRDNNTLPQVFQTNGTWRSLTAAELALPTYPFMFLAPNGKVFYAGPEEDTRFLDTKGTGKWTVGPRSNFGFRDYGSAVMYAPGKIILIGGGIAPPTNSCEIIDLNSANPQWRYTAPMNFARRQHNATLLPDGRILVTGGTSSPGFNDPSDSVFAAEIFDPKTETWTLLDSCVERRLYHSVALLLPDGRVLSAGGGLPAAGGSDYDHDNAEIFSPPYLAKGSRPTISFAPSKFSYGNKISITTPDIQNISMVSLIRLSSVTHSFNMEQRFIQLNFAKQNNRLIVQTPSSANICPPGFYLLFILNQQGIPSVGKIVQIIK
ncbi:MAG: galactose oxidase-like domain-containing protein [Acidobacteriota bacterium]